MRPHYLVSLFLVAWISATGLTGCSTTKSPTPLPHGDLTMTQIYEQTTGYSDTGQKPVTQSSLRQEVRPIATAQFTPAVTRANQVSAPHSDKDPFVALPNPSVALYVYPHLAHEENDAVPVPGYTTHFFLYEYPVYALASEVYAQ